MSNIIEPSLGLDTSNLELKDNLLKFTLDQEVFQTSPIYEVNKIRERPTTIKLDYDPAFISTVVTPPVETEQTTTTSAATTTQVEPKKGTNIGLYVGIGAVAVVGAFVFMKFRKKST
jgi:hypothetical protein